jgi:hydroxymethylglutaryl-CoA lyase
MKQLVITDVGMRDGLRMEPNFMATADKIEVGLALIGAGVGRIEATSFVSPKAIPQLADAEEVIAALKGKGAILSALAPNARGAERALKAGADELVMFISASKEHNRRNINREIDDSLKTVAEVADLARGVGRPVRGAVPMAFGCPWQGEISVEEVARMVTGFVAQGVTRYEAALGGVGGCPFASGATGNICTEDLVYLAQEMGLETGIDLARLVEASKRLAEILDHGLPGKIMKAGPRLKVA